MRTTHRVTTSRKFTPYETARNFVTFHRGGYEHSDPACVERHLATFVRCGYLTWVEAGILDGKVLVQKELI
ncbi:MAG: hypothetical protein GY938_26915 [Ketobacter sp.]|nr:hypothetical protein [Ketobacter sp.]